MTLQELTIKIENRFDVSELRSLFFTLNINYEDLPGSTRKDKIRELVQFCERHSKLDELVNNCEKLRPNELWVGNESFSESMNKSSSEERKVAKGQAITQNIIGERNIVSGTGNITINGDLELI